MRRSRKGKIKIRKAKNMEEERGVRNRPESVRSADVRYNILGGSVKADQWLLKKKRNIKDLDINDDKLMKLEILRAKLQNPRKFKGDDMLINRTKLKRYINQYGFYCSRSIADGLNTIITRMVDEAIARVYMLPLSTKRITVRAGDLPLILQ